MKNKRIKAISTVIILIAIITSIGSVLSYMFRKSDKVENNLEIASVSCEVQEKFDGESKSSITVKNTSNIPVYIRLKLISYWVDTNGNIVGEPSELPDFEISDEWIDQGNDIYCYKEIVPVNNETSNFLLENTEMILLEKNGNFQVVEVFAEAIQSEPQEAVESSWNVSVSESGTIS